MTTGARNLLILGVLSSMIAVGTAGVSLVIYHKTGDIYLDRSRPGFLPDEEEIEKQEDKKEDDYTFDSNGELTQEVLKKYLEELKEEIDSVDEYEKPFDKESLSNERLGL